jgi:hydroxyacylglutathione hydrolase
MSIIRLIVGPYETNCYLLDSDGETAVIDPGDNGDILLARVNERGSKLKYIINTHGHEDHIGANQILKQATGAIVLIHEAEKVLIDFSADRYVREGDIIKVGQIELQVIHTPGHTPGGICLLGDNFIFTGDTVFLNGIGRTDFEWSSEDDMEKSLRLLQGIIKPGMMVYPGHGGFAAYAG